MYPDLNPPIPEPMPDGFMGPPPDSYPPAWCPPDPMLDKLESHIENAVPQTPLPAAMHDPLHGILDAVEYQTEHQLEPGTSPAIPAPPETPDTVDPKTHKPPVKKEDRRPTNPEPMRLPLDQHPLRFGGYGPISPGPPGLPPEQLSPVRERPYPERKMGGSHTGIRDTGSSGRYCHLREDFIWPEDCESCNDFEEMEYPIYESECRFLHFGPEDP